MPFFVEWCSGRPTARALRQLAEMLHEPSSLRVLFGYLRLDEVWVLTRRAICAGAANVWHKLHQPCIEYPLKLFALVDPTLTDAERAENAADFVNRSRCCLDGGLSGPIQDRSCSRTQRSQNTAMALAGNTGVCEKKSPHHTRGALPPQDPPNQWLMDD